jgi:hypothetical protein
MCIHFCGILTEQQFNHFQNLSMQGFCKWVYKWLPWFWLGFMLLKHLTFSEHTSHANLLFELFFTLYLCVFMPQLRIRQIKRAWKSNKFIQGESSGTVDQNGIIWSHTYGELRCPWDLITKYKDIGDAILIYTSVNQALILPSNFFYSETDWNQCRQLVADKLPKKYRG